MNRRRHARFQTRFEVFCSSGREEGEGQLRDLSYSGAQICGATLRPALGSKIALFVLVDPSPPFEVTGTVVRRLDDGFAIEFLDFSDEICNLVEEVAVTIRAAQ